MTGETGNQLTVSEAGKYTVKAVASDGSKTSAEAESAPVEITVEGHVYVPVITKPTCTEQGYTTHTCEICGDSYVDSYTEPTGHTFIWVTDKEATATEAGSKHAECVVCGYAKAAETIPATGTTQGDQDEGNTPQTGDNSNMLFWLILCVAAAGMLIAALAYKRALKAQKK